MTDDSILYDYLITNSFNTYFKFVDGNNVAEICIKLKISEAAFYDSLNNLVLTGRLNKISVATTGCKYKDSTGTIIKSPDSVIYGYQ